MKLHIISATGSNPVSIKKLVSSWKTRVIVISSYQEDAVKMATDWIKEIGFKDVKIDDTRTLPIEIDAMLSDYTEIIWKGTKMPTERMWKRTKPSNPL